MTTTRHSPATGSPRGRWPPPSPRGRPAGWARLTVELGALLAEGRNAVAVAHVMASIGVPEEAPAPMAGTGWAAAIMGALPHGTHVSLPGEWHGVPDADLAAAVSEFFRS